jgi:hypothetical protein
MSDERPDVTEAALAGLKAASVHVLRAGQELVSAALAFVDELGDAFGDEDGPNEDGPNEDGPNEDGPNEDGPNEEPGNGPQHIPVD